MTRADKIAEYLTERYGRSELAAQSVATQLLHIADDRELITLADVTELTGRTANTIKTWMDRGQQDVPTPAYVLRRGPVWDREVIEQWMTDHPDQLRITPA